ncbi:hypothetical protein BJ912DRAFT_995828, partial [Pholiota molesta]
MSSTLPDNPGASPPPAWALASTPAAPTVPTWTSAMPSASAYFALLTMCLPLLNVFILEYPHLAVPVCWVLLETIAVLAILHWLESNE